MKKKIDGISMKSDDQIRKEVQKELRKAEREAKKEEKRLKQQQEDTIKVALAEEDTRIKEDIEKVSKMSDEDRADWLIGRHQEYIETMNWAIQGDVLNGADNVERYCLLMYLQELMSLITIYNIEFTKAVVERLQDKKEVELLSILNVLNYL